MMMVHRDNRGRPDQRRDGGDGPTCGVAVAEVVQPAGNSNSSRSLQQPFHYLSDPNTHNSTSLRSPAEMAAAAVFGFPFTNQQWKELERQVMIYKYMMASLPVPRDLLFPTSTVSSSSASPSPLTTSTGFNLRLSNSSDQEPGRCKRTDGKKWRCSRDVAPDQKYCERHMHRGRPRSRKHVEIHANNATATTTNANVAAKKMRRDNNNNINVAQATCEPEMTKNGYPTQFFGSTLQPFHQTPVYKSASYGGVNTVSSDRGVRGAEWMMKPSSSDAPQWGQELMQGSRTELTSSCCSRIPYFDATNDASVFGQRSPDQDSFLNLNTYTGFSSGDSSHQNQQDGTNDCTMFLNPDLVAMENHPSLLDETPRSFIDAWSSKSVDNVDHNMIASVPSSGHLSPASLTLSMGGYNSLNDEMGQTQMSLGCKSWLTPSSWVSSPPGGPLAEVLKPTNSAASAPSSPITTNGNHGEFSSPSGVLQKTLASFSDSSGNSSPNLTSSKAKTETVSLWLNQSKT